MSNPLGARAVALGVAAAYLRRLSIVSEFSPVASRPLFSPAPGSGRGARARHLGRPSKIIIASRCDVLTMLSFRSVVGLAFMSVWPLTGPQGRRGLARALDFIAIGLFSPGSFFACSRQSNSTTCPPQC